MAVALSRKVWIIREGKSVQRQGALKEKELLIEKNSK